MIFTSLINNTGQALFKPNYKICFKHIAWRRHCCKKLPNVRHTPPASTCPAPTWSPYRLYEQGRHAACLHLLLGCVSHTSTGSQAWGEPTKLTAWPQPWRCPQEPNSFTLSELVSCTRLPNILASSMGVQCDRLATTAISTVEKYFKTIRGEVSGYTEF